MASTTSELPIITVIGSLNTDLVTYTPRIPDGGETIYASSFSTGSGGKGGNQASACAKLSRSRDLSSASANVHMIGAVGNDLYGKGLISSLKASGVDVAGVAEKDGVETGVAVILVEEATGENRILINKGANHSLRPEEFKRFEAPLRYSALIVLQLEIPVDTTVQILKTARMRQIPILLNPAPAVDLPDEAYEGLSHLVLNETEAAELAPCKVEVLDHQAGLQQVAAVFHTKGVENVIITLGGRGVFHSTHHGEAGLVPAQKLKVVDTTAAGDTFVGAYALEVVKEGFTVEKAVRKANAVAGRTIGRKGAQISIPWADELN